MRCVQAAGLVPQFNSSDLQGTIFLPSDSALTALSSGVRSVSAQELVQILENGVALGRALRLADLSDGEALRTVSNKTLKVSKSVGITSVALADGAPVTVVLGNMDACRSVIHITSGVLQPAAAAPTSIAARINQAAFVDISAASSPTASAMAAASPGGSKEAAVLPAGALSPTLVAVIAPAAPAAPETQISGVSASAAAATATTAVHPSLIEHVISKIEAHPLASVLDAAPTSTIPEYAWVLPVTSGASASSAAAATGGGAASSAGLVTAADGPMPASSPMSSVVQAPAPGTGPVLLAPPVQPDGKVCWTALEVCEQVPSLGDFAAGIEAAGMSAALNSSSTAGTVFAFTNKGLEAVLAALQQPLSSVLSATGFVVQVMQLHVIPGRSLRAQDLTSGERLVSLLGQGLTVAVNGSFISIQPPSSGPPGAIIFADIPACSMIMHVIDVVLEPKATS
ncbi:hypothetical protein WJX81_006433 [Elliptochloris bilobata]|uniref:FAS1 domain-containing protein n=1 Tax=Elliptochloris bilobata TaxID=381761 RepID=A0AAW1QLX5_9CHLO